MSDSTTGSRAPGARPVVTMADVAARAGVSRALVSIVFRGAPGASPENRERVMRAAAELDYQLDTRARLLGSKRSRTVGVVFGLHREFHGELVEELYAAAEGTGYDLALGASAPTRDERRAVQGLVEQRCEAVVLLGPLLPRADLEALAERLPVVVVARTVRSDAVDVVRTDDVAGARLAVEHLAGLGHRSIAHVDGRRAPGATERRNGFRRAMSDLGLGDGSRIVPGGMAEEDGEQAAEALLQGEPVTAVTAFNDHCAAGLLATLRSRGLRVPGDLSLVGYDDSHLAGLASVALTTVAQDAQALATRALGLALARAEEPARPAREVVVAPSLVVRRTTAGPPLSRRSGRRWRA